jgi:uncharacterized repeat protein (TIGR01451 family)
MMRSLMHRAVVTTGAAVVVLGPAVWAASPAGADTNPACPDAFTSTATSCTYHYTGAEQNFTVPAGVTAVTVTAVGAPGGTSTDSTVGGNGAAVTATVPLPAGTTTLYAEVGGPGQTPAGDGATPGGFNGGGSSGPDGGTGGGATDVRTTSISQVPDSQLATAGDTRLVVAAGGGGGAGGSDGCGAPGGTAGDSSVTVTGAGNGGAGTDHCGNAGQGGNGGKGSPAGTGGPGSANFPGTGGDGSLGQGGSTPANLFPYNLGGGGGGGYYGGGAGGNGDGDFAGGGGGGAGSSFWATNAIGKPSMSEDDANTGTPSVIISWTLPAATTTTMQAPDSGTTGIAIPASAITATLAGANSGAGGTITYTVFGPTAPGSPPTDCTTGGTTIGTAAAAGNGPYTPSAGFTPASAGTYWWYASYAGDDNNLASASGCGQDMTAATTITPPPADLALAKTAAPNPVVSGQHLTYTLTAANTGGQAATGVTVTDPLPTTAVFGSMHTTQGTCARTVSNPNKNKTGTVTCSLGTLPGGGTATVTITVTPTIKGALANTATVAAGNITPADSDDTATATVTVHGT